MVNIKDKQYLTQNCQNFVHEFLSVTLQNFTKGFFSKILQIFQSSHMAFCWILAQTRGLGLGISLVETTEHFFKKTIQYLPKAADYLLLS